MGVLGFLTMKYGRGKQAEKEIAESMPKHVPHKSEPVVSENQSLNRTPSEKEMHLSQEKCILEHLKSGKTITQLQALSEFDCMRLSDRIFTLRKKGHQIETVMMQVNKKRVGQYQYIFDNES